MIHAQDAPATIEALKIKADRLRDAGLYYAPVTSGRSRFLMPISHNAAQSSKFVVDALRNISVCTKQAGQQNARKVLAHSLINHGNYGEWAMNALVFHLCQPIGTIRISS